MTSHLPSLGPRGEGWVALQIVLVVATVGVGLGSGGAWQGPLATVTAIAGLGLLGLGGLLGARGLVDLGGGLTPFPRPPADGRLVERGAYGLVRHPLYGALVIMAVGWGLLLASPPALLLSGVVAVFFDLKSRREEAWLVERYPTYPDYASRTRRLIPWLY